jgi:hypothetical protein
MQTKAKLEVEIAAVAEEVRELARRRGRALPTMDDWMDWLQALAATPDDLRAAADRSERGESDEVMLAWFLTRAEVTPAAEPVKEAVRAVIVPAVREERPAYFRALCALRPPLADLLARRAEAWAHDWKARSRSLDLYRGAHSWVTGASAPRSLPAPGDPRAPERAQETVARAKGWELMVLAGLALHCAAEELTAWREWVRGGAGRQHAFLSRERASTSRCCSEEPAVMWAREVARHALPEEEEAELVGLGVVSAEALAAVKALPPIPPDANSVADQAAPGTRP